MIEILITFSLMIDTFLMNILNKLLAPKIVDNNYDKRIITLTKIGLAPIFRTLLYFYFAKIMLYDCFFKKKFHLNCFYFALALFPGMSECVPLKKRNEKIYKNLPCYDFCSEYCSREFIFLYITMSSSK